MTLKISALPDQQTLLSLFAYDELTGMLTRKSTNVVVTGSPRRRYVVVGIGRNTYLAHRIIWKIKTGEDAKIIDHFDCDGKNNRWINLRAAEHRENLRNRGAPKNNTSGAKGVSFCKETGRWQAGIMVDYKHYNLGRYATIEEAAEVYRLASKRMHGEFARVA